MNPSEAQATESTRSPGLWPAAAVALVSAIVCWFGLLPGLSGDTKGKPGDDAALAELAPVNEKDLSAALTTMGGSTAFLARFKQDEGSCPRPLAWVSIVRPPGMPAGAKVRIQSGSYISPIFEVPDAPMRVAIPYPAPYENGQGQLKAFMVGGGVTIGLLPTWLVSKSGDIRTVNWHPAKRCAASNG